MTDIWVDEQSSMPRDYVNAKRGDDYDDDNDDTLAAIEKRLAVLRGKIDDAELANCVEETVPDGGSSVARSDGEGGAEGSAMKVFIRDSDAFRQLNHRDVRSYLSAQGWREVDQIDDKAIVFALKDATGQEWEILLPARRTVADYASRMAETVGILAEVEQRSELAIYHDLSGECVEATIPDGGLDPSHIANFLAMAYGPEGPYGAGAWKCGQMANLASELLLAAGFQPKICTAEISGVGHVWVEANGWWIDPTAGQFGLKKSCGVGAHPLGTVDATEINALQAGG